MAVLKYHLSGAAFSGPKMDMQKNWTAPGPALYRNTDGGQTQQPPEILEGLAVCRRCRSIVRWPGVDRCRPPSDPAVWNDLEGLRDYRCFFWMRLSPSSSVPPEKLSRLSRIVV